MSTLCILIERGLAVAYFSSLNMTTFYSREMEKKTNQLPLFLYISFNNVSIYMHSCLTPTLSLKFSEVLNVSYPFFQTLKVRSLFTLNMLNHYQVFSLNMLNHYQDD